MHMGTTKPEDMPHDAMVKRHRSQRLTRKSSPVRKRKDLEFYTPAIRFVALKIQRENELPDTVRTSFTGLTGTIRLALYQ